MKKLFKDISNLVVVSNKKQPFKAGIQMKELKVIHDGAVFFDERIRWVGTTTQAEKMLESKRIKADFVLSMKGKTVAPGFIDSHTHFVFAGDRSNEFAMRVAGKTYQEIAELGGGILSTVRATRIASEEVLFDTALKHIQRAIQHGTVAFEIKSGYGLDMETELKMLRVIRHLKEELPVEIIPTFLGAHDFPPEYRYWKEDYIDLLCKEVIPKVAKEGLAVYCDCFVDRGYYTIDQARRIFEIAQEYGLKIKMHADELANVGAAKLAAEVKAISADHLLFVDDQGINAMKESGTIATLLPGTSYFIKMPYAKARKIIDSGLPVALATDFNPGSCFTQNMQLILSLATINLGMTCEEAMVAATLNGAAAIELSENYGSIEEGKYASLVVFDVPNYLEIFYNFGVNHVESVWIKGERYC